MVYILFLGVEPVPKKPRIAHDTLWANIAKVCNGRKNDDDKSDKHNDDPDTDPEPELCSTSPNHEHDDESDTDPAPELSSTSPNPNHEHDDESDTELKLSSTSLLVFSDAIPDHGFAIPHHGTNNTL